MQQLLDQAIALHQAKKLPEAEALYRQVIAAPMPGREKAVAQAMGLLGVLIFQNRHAAGIDEAAQWLKRATELDPGNAETWTNLGEIERRRGRAADSIAALRSAVRLAPTNAWGHYNLGVALRSAGDAASAETCFRKALDALPAMSEAWINLGVLLVETGRAPEAIACFEKMRALAAATPRAAEVESHYGWALWEAGRHAEGIAAFERAVTMNPQFAPALANWGAALSRMGRRAEALAAYRRAAAAAPHVAQTQRELGVVLMENGQLDEAESTCRRAVELDPPNAEGMRALAVVLGVRGEARRAEARDVYARAIALKRASGQPVPPDWEFEHAALGDAAAVTAAPAAFVRGLFDAYALKFDSHVAGELQYRVPAELSRMILEVRGTPAREKWAVLDLGCGTGLCGAALSPHARRLVGADLSPKMVEVARSRGIYDELLVGDVTAAMRDLEKRGERFDVIVAGDVFIYVGALEELFAAARRILNPGGVIAFSLERHDGEGFVLSAQRRFAHSLTYVKMAAAGFTEARVEEGHIRKDVANGWWVVLVKSSGPA